MLSVAFLHPDLGIGGAERLVVDAATGLQAAGHRVVLLTAHHDPAHAFPETTDGTLDVRVHGRLVPDAIAGRVRAPCAIARMAWLSYVAGRLAPSPDVVVCDLVSHTVPLLRRTVEVPTLFYCHYPDRLLAHEQGGAYRWYRVLIDRLEGRGLAAADRLLVNSRFTAARLVAAFPDVPLPPPIVVHPGVEIGPVVPLPELPPPGPIVVLSLARFDPLKRLGLAIETLADLRTRLPSSIFARVQLVLAGAYDARLPSQRAVRAELERQVAEHRLGDQVIFRISPSEEERRALLADARLLLFTPPQEHFGYVPLEAMAAGRPVVASSAGGPAETVMDGTTGILCPPRPDAFGAALARLLTEPALAAEMGRAGREHVARHFSRTAFQTRFEAIVRELAASDA